MATQQGQLFLMLLLLAAVLLLQLPAPANALYKLRTACEYKKISIACHRGFKIRIVSAFYGRASKRICPSRQQQNRRRCHSKRSLAAVRRLCNGRHSCSVTASNRLFGNPCRGVRKYLRVRFVCKFGDCRRIRRIQEKLLKQFRRLHKQRHHSQAAWKVKREMHHVMTKVNRLRRRYSSCFHCSRGCRYLQYVERHLARKQRQIRSLMQGSRWRVPLKWKRKSDGRRRSKRHPGTSRWYLRRKLWYYRRHRRLMSKHLHRCLQLCLY